MDQRERREYLIGRLKDERSEYKKIAIPNAESDQRRLLRALMNVRMPGEIDQEFLNVQDEYLKEARDEKGIVSIDDIDFNQDGIGIWKGDITRLQVDAIVNAANSGMTGCYVANHSCIDNCIHTYAGVQMRYECARIMEEQGHEEPTGQAKITPGYNLPCKYVLHTVGPIVQGRLTEEHERLLASCYRSCLELAAEKGLESVAFCCISTGVFMFPNERAAEIAVQTVKDFMKKDSSVRKVIFNVFKDVDEQIYRGLLG
ncbi:O-acetyl-ADP-ribose deacetylase (regulator of RNase III), contains Macro domain [Butyrivibrio sp. INlla18]|uniref:protein-ADP-ribose hydrolase n=1 Tax=Butyrivibrio sp. INlla18 TaxID=1520806 RepID=UPI0008857699|nr:protein-ADP-ribose hydrolase [Butyrivibrio sp. INlla18]SDA58715.1 O-acetyl-ADP-ribose deacetylase (regulator of RNase III), contains Macro domain [Butyrivibrio sp. INlla18]